MPFSVSPSVTVTERDLSALIPQASTSTAAFVGRFNWGPVDQVVTISSEKELSEIFGFPDSGERGIDWFVVANYLNYGDRVHVVRVDEGNDIFGDAAGLTAARLFDGSTGAYLRARDSGTRGNSLRVAALTANLGAQASGGTYGGYFGDDVSGGVRTVDNHVNMTTEFGKIFSYAPTSTDPVYESFRNGVFGQSRGVTQDECHIAVIDVNGVFGASGAVLEKFEGLSRWKGVADRVGNSLYYKDVINSESNYIEIEPSSRNSIWIGAGFTALGSFGSTGDPSWSKTSSEVYETGLRGDQNVDGTWNHHYDGDGYAKQPYGDKGTISETPGVSGIGSTFAWTMSYNNILRGGADHGITFTYDGVGFDSASGIVNNLRKGIVAAYNKHFRENDFIDFDFILGGAAEETLSAQLIDLVEKRKDCMVFLSPPNSPTGAEYNDVAFDTALAGWSGPTNLVNYRNSNNLNSSYAVMDSGWKYMYDSYNDRNRWVPLNSDTAGLVARLDNTSEPYASPAGFNRGRIQNVVKLALNPTKEERDELYSNGINPIVAFPGEGTVLFGDKTLQRRASSLDRINVRRLLLTLEKAVATAAKFRLFEFNDSFTRNSFVSSIEPFLRRVQAQRGIQEFRIVCDSTNNPSSVVDENKFVADIFIKPSRSINFIQLNFTTLRSDALFDEAVV